MLLLSACQQEGSTDQSDTARGQDSIEMATDDGRQKIVLAITEDPRHDRAKLYGEVMEVHDITMPKMTQVNRMIRQLKALRANDQVTLTETQKQSLHTFQKTLEEAEEGMFAWMNDFREPTPSMPQEEAMTYLQDQKNQMLAIDSTIDVTLRKAAEFLKPLTTK